MTANCWLHETIENTEAKKKTKLKDVPIVRADDYTNNLKIIMTPSKDEAYIENLEQDANHWKTAYEIHYNKVQELEQELVQKADRIAQLDQLLKGSAQIFTNQNGVISTLRSRLEKEKSATGISVEYNRHLEKDIKLLDEQKQELDNRIKELETEEIRSQTVRDQELTDLKAQITQKDSEISRLSTDVYQIRNNFCDLLEGVSNILQPGLVNKIIANSHVVLFQQSREVIALLDSERIQKEQVIRERDDYLTKLNNRPDITLIAWENDWSKRPTLISFNDLSNQLGATNKERDAYRQIVNREQTWIYKYSLDKTLFYFFVWKKVK